jgi:hypothetical protein
VALRELDPFEVPDRGPDYDPAVKWLRLISNEAAFTFRDTERRHAASVALAALEHRQKPTVETIGWLRKQVADFRRGANHQNLARAALRAFGEKP